MGKIQDETSMVLSVRQSQFSVYLKEQYSEKWNNSPSVWTLLVQTWRFCFAMYPIRNVLHGGCRSSQLCLSPCPSPSQVCDFTCYCSPGWRPIVTQPPSVSYHISDFNILLSGSRINFILSFFKTPFTVDKFFHIILQDWQSDNFKQIFY